MAMSRQQDEISVLESIFNEEEIIRSDQHGTSAGQFCAHIELPDDFHLIYKSSDCRSNQALVEIPHIAHLPPIVLHYSLPDDYPLNPNAPPTFTLACHWLSREKLGKLCKELDRLWEDNKCGDDQGNEVLYIWAQFLKTESLALLDLPNNTLDITSIERIYYLSQSNCKAGMTPKCSSYKEEHTHIATSLGASNASQGNAGILAKSTSTSFELDVSLDICDVSYGSPTSDKVTSKLRKPSPELDCRAVLDIAVDSSLEEYLVAYNEEKLKGVFNRQHHTCNICFLNKTGSNCTKFLPCGHIFCVECTDSYFSLSIKEGKVLNIKCPESKCDSDAQFNQIKEVISPEHFEKYDAMLLEATLNAMGDIVVCPRPECQYSVSRDGDDKLANCFRCRYAFCVDCRMGYHGVEPCRFKSAEEQRLVEEYNEGTKEQRLTLEKRYSKRRLEALVENSLTKAWISDNSKNCPHCNAAIQKTFGCNKMVCWKCGSHFCWICGTRLDTRFPYLHFTLVTSKCYQLLFHGIDQDPDAPPDEEYFEELEEELNEDDEEDDDIGLEEEYIVAQIAHYNNL